MDECEKESSLLRRAQEEVAIQRKKVDNNNLEQETEHFYSPGESSLVM